MIKYQKIQGVELAEVSSLPKIEQTPEGLAMGGIPGWVAFVDPAYIVRSPGQVRNRAIRNTMGSATSDVVNGSFANGALSFDHTADPFNLTLPVNGINNDAWSVFFVANVTSGIGVQYIFRSSPIISSGDGVGTSVGFGASGGHIIVYEPSEADDGNPQRLSYNGAFASVDRAQLFMVTFSTTHGLKIYVDGALVASDPDDKAPLTNGHEIDSLLMYRSTRGDHGMGGLLNIDLSAPENTGHRRAIGRFLMAKYGIPEGPQ